MTRSAMAKRILRKLKEWDGSQKTLKTAYEILDVVENAGMSPPDQRAHLPPPEEIVQEWEPERKRK